MATMQPEPRAAGRLLIWLPLAVYLSFREFWLQFVRQDRLTNQRYELQKTGQDLRHSERVDVKIGKLDRRLKKIRKSRAANPFGDVVANAIVRAVIRVSAFANSVITAWQAGRRDKQPNHSS